MGDTIASFNPHIYAKCLKTFKVKAEEKNDPELVDGGSNNEIKILFEMLYKEFQDKIVSEVVNTLCQHNSSNKYNLKMSKNNARDAIEEEAKKISSAEYVPCFKVMYKRLSSIIYSHH